MSEFLKNTASQNVGFSAMDLAGDPKTSGVSVWITKDNGTRTASGGTLTHKGGGDWNYAPTQAETNADLMALSWGGTDVVIGTLNVYTTTKRVSSLNDIAAGAKMDIVDAPNATGLAAVKTAMSFPANFSSLGISGGGAITTVSTVTAIGTDGIPAAALSSGAIAKIEAALLNEGDGNALIDAIVQAIDAADIDTDILPALIRDSILNRVLAGNHDTAGTLGKLIQSITEVRLAELDAANLPAVTDGIVAKTTNLPANPASTDDVTDARDAILARGNTAWMTATGFVVSGDLADLASQDSVDDLQALLDALTQGTGAATQFTEKALELAPAGEGGGGGEGGLTGEQDEKLDSIYTKTLLINQGKVSILSPLIDGGKTLVLVRGDSYTSTSPRGVLAWEPANDSDWPNLTGAEGTLTVRNSSDEVEISQAVTIVNPAGPDKKITVSLTAALTADLSVSEKPNDHKFDLQITTTDGDIWTPIRGGDNLRSGGLTVVEDQTRPAPAE